MDEQGRMALVLSLGCSARTESRCGTAPSDSADRENTVLGNHQWGEMRDCRAGGLGVSAIARAGRP